MPEQHGLPVSAERTGGGRGREQLLAGAPVTERRLQVAGVSTAVLEAGEGPPVVLLHGQGAWAGMWLPVIPGLAASRRLVVPDLPGLGASVVDAPLSSEAVLAWVAGLIEQTCETAPAIVGLSLGGSIAARFAASHPDRLASLTLVDAGGLTGRVRPRPDVLLALIRQSVRPSERNILRMLRRLTVDLAGVQERMGPRWAPFVAYMTDLARTPSVQRANRQLLRDLGLPAIPPDDLARIRVPTTLIWGRHDRVARLRAAQEASERHGWPLHVIEEAGHLSLLDQPEAVLHALRASLGSRPG